MALLGVPASGILQTYVTWDDIQDELYKAFSPTAKLGSQRSATELSDGRGFLSKVARIDPDWIQVDENLPQFFVVKILSLLTLTGNAAKRGEVIPENSQLNAERLFKQLHNLEVSTYMQIQKLNDLPTLKFYGGRKFSEDNQLKGYLLFEYVDCVTSIHAHTRFSDRQITQCLSWLAKFHALASQFPKEDAKKMERSILSDGFGYSLKLSEINNNILPRIKEAIPHVKAEIFQKFGKSAAAMGEEMFMKFIDDTAEHLDMPRVLCHGDPWTPNLLFEDVDGEIRLKTIVDLQNAHFGCAGYDLARLLTSILDVDQSKNVNKYLKIYHKLSVEAFGEERLTESQIIESFCRFQPALAYLHTFSVVTHGKRIEKKKELDNLEEAVQYTKQKGESLIFECIEGFAYLKEKFEEFKSANDS